MIIARPKVEYKYNDISYMPDSHIFNKIKYIIFIR